MKTCTEHKFMAKTLYSVQSKIMAKNLYRQSSNLKYNPVFQVKSIKGEKLFAYLVYCANSPVLLKVQEGVQIRKKNCYHNNYSQSNILKTHATPLSRSNVRHHK